MRWLPKQLATRSIATYSKWCRAVAAPNGLSHCLSAQLSRASAMKCAAQAAAAPGALCFEAARPHPPRDATRDVSAGHREGSLKHIPDPYQWLLCRSVARLPLSVAK